VPLTAAEVVTPPPLPLAATAASPAPRAPQPAPEAGVRAATPIPAPQTPPASPATPGAAAAAAGSTAGSTKKGGVPGPHRSRTPSSGFSAVEADFFNREADLYKPAETFDDLDASSSSPDLVTGKGRPARKT